MESNRRALTTFSWHQTYMGIKIPGVAGVEVSERLPSLAPPCRGLHVPAPPSPAAAFLPTQFLHSCLAALGLSFHI